MKRLGSRQSGGRLFLVLSALVAVSMICGTVLVILPAPQRRVPPTATPTSSTPTPAATVSPVPPTVMPTPTIVVAPTPVPRPTT